MTTQYQNMCPICGERPVKGKNLTCGEVACRNASSKETRQAHELDEKLTEMRTHYGDENPWTQWLRKAMGR